MTFLEAKQKYNRYISPHSYTTDTRVGEVILLAAQRLCESGYWKGNLYETTTTTSSDGIITPPVDAQSIVEIKGEQIGTKFTPFRKEYCKIIPQDGGTYRTSPPKKNCKLTILVARKFVPPASDSDQIIPDNPNALRYAIQAFMYDDNNDLERAKVYWDQAYLMLSNEQQKETIGETPSMNIAPLIGRIPNII